jgi:hypothetical protein
VFRSDQPRPRRNAAKFTKLVSPSANNRRAARRPQIYALLRRWHEFRLLRQERFLLLPHHERWLEKGRVTAEMAAELLVARVAELARDAGDPLGDPSSERERMIQILKRRVSLPPPLSAQERDLLDALEDLQVFARHYPPPMLIYRGRDGLSLYEESEPVRERFRALRIDHRRALDGVISSLAESVESETTVRLHRRGAGAVVSLGERKRAEQRLQEFRLELGERFLDSSTPVASRAASVRKWRQLAGLTPSRDRHLR